MKQFFFGRIKSIKYSVTGVYLLICTEHSIISQLCIAVLLTFLGFYFEISYQDWINQIIIIAMVLSMEGLNTAVEKIADFIHPDYDSKIGLIKDIAAGAVGISAMAGTLVLILTYLPYITQ